MSSSTNKRVISCQAPFGGGGLGQHLKQVVQTAATQHHSYQYYCSAPEENNPSGLAVHPFLPKLLPYSPFRYSPGWINFVGSDCFDRTVASKLSTGNIFEGFVGQSLQSFRRARQLHYAELRLQAANSHVNNVVRQHQTAIQRFGIETSWLNDMQRRKTLKEYAMADYIYVASEYSHQTMLAEGIPENKLRRIKLQVSPRYQAPLQRQDDGMFRVVYVGSLTVMKGIPLLVEAFSRLEDKNAELILVGGWATRGMRRYLQAWMARDPRIQVRPGDPLPHLQRASVCVHPTYEDGFAYAPAEAMACGVPVIVTEDTGMKEYVQDGVNGYVVPTDNWEAILERLEVCRYSLLSRSGT